MEKVLFVEYPKCTTCQKAKKWLEAHGVPFDDRNVKEENPTQEELEQWLLVLKANGDGVKKLFNTSGVKYKELSLKDKIPGMAEAEQIALLATDGMLVKRPLVIGSQLVLVGFKEKEWEKALLA